MCKPSCCPGTGNSGGGLAVLAVIAIVIIAAAARPAVHAALAVAHAVITITLITVAALAGLAVPAAVALAIQRARRAHPVITSTRPVSGPARPSVLIPAQVDRPVTARQPLALAPPDPARGQQARPDPEQIAQIVTAVLRGLQ